MTDTIAALLREREHYTRRGLPDRVAAVDTELARKGHKQEVAAAPAPPPAPPKPETASIEAPETTTRQRPQPRRSTPDAQ